MASLRPAESRLDVSPAARRTVKPWLGDSWRIAALPLLFFLLLPLVALLLRTSPESILENLRRPVVIQSIRVSLTTTLAATALIVLFGTPVAFFLARRRLPFHSLVETLIDLPTVLPPAVAGVALLMTFGRRGLLGGLMESIDLDIAFTQMAVVLAQVFIAAPFFVKSAAIGFGGIDPELEQAASLDGANGWQVFRYVIAPLSWTALLSGTMMSWARALGEFGATIIFAGNFPGRTQTMPLAVYIGFEIDLEIALTLSVILVGFSFLILSLVRVLLRPIESI